MGLLALFLGAFLIFNTFRTIVLERRHDLSMLRAIGATRAQLTQMVRIESFIQGLVGTLLGLLLGYLMAVCLANAMNNIIVQYLPTLHMSLVFQANVFLGPIALGILTTLIAGYFPARAASRVSPMEGLRPATASNMRRAARWSLIAGLVIMALAVVLLISSPKTTAGGALLVFFWVFGCAPGFFVP